MLGHVYVVEDAKDLAQIVRDVTRYGGAYRPEASFLSLSLSLSHFSLFTLVLMLAAFSLKGYLRIYPEKIGLEEDRESGGQDDV